jgi:AcrR family transcriptional regulator
MTSAQDSALPGSPPGEEAPSDLHLWKLPRGRHGLPPEVVAQSQQERLLAAVLRVTADKGYQETSVADVLKEAGVGRESFYRHFKDKEACFLAASEALTDDLEARVRQEYDQPGAWPERVRGGLAAALAWFAANPEIARVMLVEMGAVGPVARERFRTSLHRFTAMLDEGREPAAPVAGALPDLASIALGAVVAKVYEEVVLGDAASLPLLLPQLTFELLLPYVGETVARREQRKAAKAAAGA